MNPTSVLPSLCAVVVALASTAYLARFLRLPDLAQRYTAIDGLRGYLAFFVFLHHACIWYFFLQSGEWRPPPSNLYTHFGQSSVAMFFMITGFLFFSKLLDGRQTIDWLRLFVSRFLRLTPAYLVMLAIMFGVVMLVSDADIRSAPVQVSKDALRWMSFTILGAPDLNGLADTWRITAGVTWSLPYEWFFYFSLPLLALTTGSAVPLRYLLPAAAAVLGMLWVWEPLLPHFLSFLTGIIAALCVRSSYVRVLTASRWAAVFAFACLAVMVNYLPTSNAYLKAIPLALAFIVIACGNSLFGLLTHRLSRMLGEMAFSLYLMHGILLYVSFSLIFRTDTIAALSAVQYWALVISLTPILLGICAMSTHFVEQPAMRQTSRLTQWLRGSLTRHKAARD